MCSSTHTVWDMALGTCVFRVTEVVLKKCMSTKLYFQSLGKIITWLQWKITPQQRTYIDDRHAVKGCPKKGGKITLDIITAFLLKIERWLHRRGSRWQGKALNPVPYNLNSSPD